MILEDHLYSLGDSDCFHTNDSFKMAAAIRRDPQAHIDALVEAGVLENVTNTSRLDLDLYRLVELHVHKPWVVSTQPSGMVLLNCSCGGSWTVRNLWTGELPK